MSLYVSISPQLYEANKQEASTMLFLKLKSVKCNIQND